MQSSRGTIRTSLKVEATRKRVSLRGNEETFFILSQILRSGKQAESKGLEKVAKDLLRMSDGRFKDELSGIIPPERKLVVMIIGNHSAGKSSFINWYVGEDIQRAKVSIETIEINLIMNGKHKQEFNGLNASKFLPFLKDLINTERKEEKFPGLMENLILKTSISTEKNFENVIFIDTPGLADGNLKYKFNIEETLEWFS
jgi:ribosome biogenesis GTPase A